MRRAPKGSPSSQATPSILPGAWSDLAELPWSREGRERLALRDLARLPGRLFRRGSVGDRVSERLHRAVRSTAVRDRFTVCLWFEEQTRRRPCCRQRSCRSQWRGRRTVLGTFGVMPAQRGGVVGLSRHPLPGLAAAPLGRDLPQENRTQRPPKPPAGSSGTFAWLWAAVSSGRDLITRTRWFCAARAVVEAVPEAGVITASRDQA